MSAKSILDMIRERQRMTAAQRAEALGIHKDTIVYRIKNKSEKWKGWIIRKTRKIENEE